MMFDLIFLAICMAVVGMAIGVDLVFTARKRYWERRTAHVRSILDRLDAELNANDRRAT